MSSFFLKVFADLASEKHSSFMSTKPLIYSSHPYPSIFKATDWKLYLDFSPVIQYFIPLIPHYFEIWFLSPPYNL